MAFRSSRTVHHPEYTLLRNTKRQVKFAGLAQQASSWIHGRGRSAAKQAARGEGIKDTKPEFANFEACRHRTNRHVRQRYPVEMNHSLYLQAPGLHGFGEDVPERCGSNSSRG